MRSWWIQSLHGAAALEAREVAVPEPGSGQLLVRLRAAGLNRGEFIAAHGITQPGAAKPAGTEGAGEVARLGAGVSGYSHAQRAATVRGFVADLLPAIADGRIRPLIDRVYAFDQLPQAKAFMESNAHLGKIVLRSV